MISTIDPPNSSASNKSSSGGLKGSRRPSYVGLSKSVSGYSTLYKLSDERAPATIIPVSKDPQTLDAMRQEFHYCKVSVETVRESSPGSDSNSSSSSSIGGCGNLVQKQIERLYGGKLNAAVIRSPPRSEEKLESRDLTDTSPALELKVPAVFRLLRPEFREQLKMHSCTVEIPGETLAKKERIIPITKIGHTKTPPPKERIIPIQRENQKPLIKPALPAKPTSPLMFPSSPVKESEPPKIEESPAPLPSSKETLLPAKSELFSEESSASDDDEHSSHIQGGLRERELLCTIVEEDNESTASGYSLPRVNGHRSVPMHVENIPEKVEDEAIDLLPKKDGNYFIKLIENEVFKFEEQICDFEEDLCNNEALMNEDVQECILAAIGKAKLLMGQKLAQFRGLCDRNINSTIESDPFVPTSDDLAGFWDMVFIQVEHIHFLFAELVEIRKNGWKKPEVDVKLPTTNGRNSFNSKTKDSRPLKKKKNPASQKPKSEAAKARDEARRKMLEERKKQLMKQKQSETQNNNNSSNANGLVMFL
uniref:Uncharacterized protein n=1 Tax=Lepeophtheirus salmonis TaxID=72036 RepID=A0A0K2V3J5_LEPSM